MQIAQNTRLINEETGEYPVYLRHVRREKPHVSLPQIPTDDQIKVLGYYPVSSVSAPDGDVVSEGVPEKVEGEYRQTWNVRDHTQNETEQRLNARKDRLQESANRIREVDFSNGMPHTFIDTDTVGHVHLKPADRVILLGLRMQAREMETAGVTDAVFQYRTMENDVHVLDTEEMITMTTQALGFFEQIMANSWTTKDLIEAAQTEGELPEVPETFVPVT